MKEKGEFIFRIKHVGDTALHLDNMGKALESYYKTVEMYVSTMNLLQEQEINKHDALNLFAGFIVEDPQPVEVSTRASNQYKKLTYLFEHGRGNDGNDLSDVMGATTDYYTHYSAGGTENPQRQFESGEFGSGQRAKEDMLTLLVGGKVAKLGDLAECMARGARVLQVAAG
jgi:hypothetical protein